MYVYMHACVYMNAIRVGICFTFTYVCVCMYACMRGFSHTVRSGRRDMYVCMYAPLYVHMYACVSLNTCKFLYTHTCRDMFV